MFGTDFSYEEFERLQGIATESPVRRLDDAEAMGRDCYVLEITPEEEEGSAYQRIEAFIDKETCIALRAEFYERGDQPRKVMTSDPLKVTREDGVWVPRESVMRDFRDETQTTMLVEEIEVGKEIARKIFSERELVSGGR
jgi:outer membrane lipoprotein-sorting protein